MANTYTYSPFNRLTATQTATYSFDANGNTVGKSEGGKRWMYIWDHENRLAVAKDRKTNVRYRYDALGRRVQRVVGYGRENTKFIYDGQNVIADDNSGTLTKYQNGPGIDNKLRVQTGSDVKYFLADHLGSTNGLADPTGSLAASTAYDSFGNPTNANFPSRYQYTGREFDGFTGLQFSRARFYDPKVGRFISEDPIRFRGGDINLFAYVWNIPQGYIDPSGLGPFKLPANPGSNGSNLPKGWRPVPGHRGSERWASPDGSEGLDFDKATPGKSGYGGKDHWHKLKPGRSGELERDKSGGRKGGHYLPGDEVDVKDCPVEKPDLSQPSLEEMRLNEQYYRNMERFWTTILAGDVVLGAVLTGGAFGGFGGPMATAAESGGLGLLPAFGF